MKQYTENLASHFITCKSIIKIRTLHADITTKKFPKKDKEKTHFSNTVKKTIELLQVPIQGNKSNNLQEMTHYKTFQHAT